MTTNSLGGVLTTPTTDPVISLNHLHSLMLKDVEWDIAPACSSPVTSTSPDLESSPQLHPKTEFQRCKIQPGVNIINLIIPIYCKTVFDR